MKKQSAADKAFVAKIQSITIGSGSKPAGPTCSCGKPLKLAGIGVLMRVQKMRTRAREEVAFSA